LAKAALQTMIALLAGINVGGNRKVPMADLRALATKLGYSQVETYIASGNLVFRTTQTPVECEVALEAAIEKKLGFFVDVVVRTAAEWSALAKLDPLAPLSATQGSLAYLLLTKKPHLPTAVKAIRERAAAGERVEERPGALFIHYPKGAGTTKLSPAFLDKAAGSKVTARNWNTVLALEAMAAKHAG